MGSVGVYHSLVCVSHNTTVIPFQKVEQGKVFDLEFSNFVCKYVRNNDTYLSMTLVYDKYSCFACRIV